MRKTCKSKYVVNRIDGGKWAILHANGNLCCSPCRLRFVKFDINDVAMAHICVPHGRVLLRG